MRYIIPWPKFDNTIFGTKDTYLYIIYLELIEGPFWIQNENMENRTLCIMTQNYAGSKYVSLDRTNFF